MVRCVTAALLLCLLTGCYEPFPPGQGYEPPAVYREWWAATEACTGRSAEFGRVTWEVLPDSLLERDGVIQLGRTERGRWVIMIHPGYLESEKVVRHEMAHLLLGTSDHPVIPFTSPCGLYPLEWSDL